MKYSIMITSLFGGKANPDVDYYYTSDSERTLYCDAILAAEASSKYMLANHHIDEIITLGSKTTYDPGDEMKQIVLREGSSFYSSDIRNLSTYSLLRYRLAQYIDEIRIEDQDIRDLLTEEEQSKIKDFCRMFYSEHIKPDMNIRFNRMFDLLRSDEYLRKLFMKEIMEALPEVSDDPMRYRAWTLNYLYGEMKDTAKLELLNGNEEVKIRFIPTDTNGSLSFGDKLANGFNRLIRKSGTEIDIDLYICILSEDATDSFALINFIDILKAISNSHVKIRKIATATHMSDDFTNAITDDTELYGISDLLAGTRAFLQYGKTDLLMDYWKKQNMENVYIERLLNAMRTIDVGISLCDITDIERGINTLRAIFDEGDFIPSDNLIESYFDIIINGIKDDYGVLVTGDRVNFIDLVKWAYRKGFWQQTLTLIESRAPRDFVHNGIYYYLDSDEDREKVVSIFGEIYYNLRHFEKYKLDDIDHYFVKFYGRDRTDKMDIKGSGIPFQRAYAEVRISDLDIDDEAVIRAHTLCSDKETLYGLLFAYNVIGYVRNVTNHAEESVESFGRKEGDVSERLNLIRQAVETFISCYDKVMECMPGEHSHIMRINNSEIRAYAQTLKTARSKSSGDKKQDNLNN